MQHVATITVFTPAYNRAHTLPRTYQSLRAQDCKDFIWLVVDDGSTDGTAELVHGWMQDEMAFEIQYVYKENGGMHTAHNTAYDHIATELNVCIDSDDALAPGAISHILSLWRKLPPKQYAGIVGLDADLNTGAVIGTPFPEETHFTTLQRFYAEGGKGDKKLVYRTDIMKALPPYPVFPGEKYFSLGWKYLLCDQQYELAVTNQVLCLVEYQPDGSSRNMLRQYRNNPRGFAYLRLENMKYNLSARRTFVDCVHYVSSSLLAGNRHFLRESPKKMLTILGIPGGILLTWYIHAKLKSK